VTGAWVLRDEASAKADLLLEDIAATAVSMVVPALWWYEMASLLRSAVLRDRLEQDAARSAFLGLHDVLIDTIDPLRQGRSGILAASLDFGLSAYDATYLEDEGVARWLARVSAGWACWLSLIPCALMRRRSWQH